MPVSFTKKAADIFRDFTSELDVLSSRHEPAKVDIRTWGKTIEDTLVDQDTRITTFAASTGDPAALNQYASRLTNLETADTTLTAQVAAEQAARKAVLDEAGEGLQFVDQDGFTVMAVDANGTLRSPNANFAESASFFEIVDPVGFVLLRSDDGGTLIAGLTDPDGDEEAWSTAPLFSDRLCVAQGHEAHLYLRNIMAERSDDSRIRGTFASPGSNDGARPVYLRSGDDDLVIDVAKCGPSAQLITRPSGQNPSLRHQIDLTLTVAPVPAPGGAKPIRVLMIGDSITNRAMGISVQNYLTQWGYAPTFIGTLRGASFGEAAGTGVGGPLGEGREGWEFGDFTNAVIDRTIVVQPGEEAAYLAMSKEDQWPRNPMIRAAVDGDDPALVRNGHVWDFAFYLSRFGLAAPDVVFIGLGTNDIRDREPPELQAAITDGLTIMRRQIRAAAPSARIVVWFPPAVRSGSRDDLWSAEYVEVLRALVSFKRASGDTKLFLAPAWGMANQEIAGSYSSSFDAASGVSTLTVADAVHLGPETRLQVAEILAAHAAAVAANLI